MIENLNGFNTAFDMKKIGGFINPWGNGHFTRMMALDESIRQLIGEDLDIHYTSGDGIYQKLVQRFPAKKENIHNIAIPTPVDGKRGPSITLSLLNFVMPMSGRRPLISVMAEYLKSEGRLYDQQKFDLVINDGDVGSNVIAEKRHVKSVFVTNQFKPKLWTSRSFLYPGLVYISKNIAKASKIVVCDSPPPYTICEYNLNFPEKIKSKVVYTGHFSNGHAIKRHAKSDLEKLVENADYGYWMVTGNKSTNETTSKTYQKIFRTSKMRNERRIVSHAKKNSFLDRVQGKDGKTYSISEALEEDVDWIQIDVGFLSEQEKDTVLNLCKYAVTNGSHTAMGEIIGGKGKPVIGIPVYDEHTNNIKWAEDRNLAILATTIKQTTKAVDEIHRNYNKFQERLDEFSKNYNRNGAAQTAKIILEMLEN